MRKLAVPASGACVLLAVAASLVSPREHEGSSSNEPLAKPLEPNEQTDVDSVEPARVFLKSDLVKPAQPSSRSKATDHPFEAPALPSRRIHASETCDDGVCPERLAAGVHELFDICSEHVEDKSVEIYLNAQLVGDHGAETTVESVTVEGPASLAFKECVQESAFTLDLGRSNHAFAQAITVAMSSSPRISAGADVDPAERAAVEEFLNRNSAQAEGPGTEIDVVLLGEPSEALE